MVTRPSDWVAGVERSEPAETSEGSPGMPGFCGVAALHHSHAALHHSHAALSPVVRQCLMLSGGKSQQRQQEDQSADNSQDQQDDFQQRRRGLARALAGLSVQQEAIKLSFVLVRHDPDRQQDRPAGGTL